LDDVMLAMDVVDTLRRKQRLVEQELDVAGREQDLKQRLRKIYAAQGIEVTDAILEEGVAALKEDRFRLQAAAGLLRRHLGAALRQARASGASGCSARWRPWPSGCLPGSFLVVAPRNALPKDLETLHAEVVELAVEDSVDQRRTSCWRLPGRRCAMAIPPRARALYA
jgi:hypothetical protein